MSTTTTLGRPAGSNGDETRQRIIEATMRCVVELGYSRATVREIARMAQMTGGSLYHYFPNKSELVKATVAEIAGKTEPRLRAAADRPGSALDKLMFVFDECDAVMVDYPYVAAFDRAIRAENVALLSQVGGDAESMATMMYRIAEDIIRQARREKSLARDTDVRSAAEAVYTIIRGLTEYAAVAPTDDYHSTVHALKLLIRGQLLASGSEHPLPRRPAAKRRAASR